MARGTRTVRAIWALGISLLALALAACSSGGTGSEEPPQPTTYKSFAYVANCGSDSISAFSIDSESGALTEVAGAILPANTAPRSIAIGPSGRFLYAVGTGYPRIYAYAINSRTGALTDVRGSPFSLFSIPQWVVVDPSGHFAYAVSYENMNISAFSIDPRTGALTAVPGSPFGAAGGPLMIVIEAAGKFAFVLNYDSESVSAFSINRATGALSHVTGPAVGVGTRPQSIVIDPSGKFVYVANEGSENISAFSIDTVSGTLIPVAGSPFEPTPLVMHFPESIAVEPSGRFVYVVSGSGNILTFSINAATGALAPVIASSAFWDSPYAIAFEHQGKYAYVVYWRPSGFITVHSCDPDSGALFTESMWTVGGYSSAVAISRIAQ
jgi:6-phosphogluconolactonase